ncbi:unnamed protein product [Staurois parvus]|uniref:Uncharacterized protein n=1 Tax=Staurois parvus TaxID=386267 RepID=A0ABN9E732_9NEOB|nr:unnamed protein product [Staurois parvus]
MGPPGNRGSWGPVSLPKLKKAYEKGTRGISWGPLLTPGPRAVPGFPKGQSFALVVNETMEEAFMTEETDRVSSVRSVLSVSIF